MQSIVVSIIVFVSLCGGVGLGMWSARRLREEHLSKETEDAVKLGVGMVAAMASLILGLMTASVKGNFDTTARDVQRFSTDLITLDVTLRTFGPAAQGAHAALLVYARHAVAETWPEAGSGTVRVESESSERMLEEVGHQIRSLEPASDRERELRSEALADYRTLTTLRWTVVAEAIAAVPPVFIGVIIVWLTLIFMSFGLFAPVNAVSLVAFFLCAVSLAGALFLILEMSGPFGGVIQVSSRPMRTALEQIAR